MNEHYFVSYSRVDGEGFAKRLADRLLAGPPPYAVWLDVRNLQPGSDWDDQIRDAIENCRGLLFVMTKDSVQGQSACKQEWAWALQCKKPVIPLRTDAGAKLPFRLSSRQYVDFSGGFDGGLVRLRGHLASVGSPGWVLQELRNQMTEAQRELQRADPAEQRRIKQDIKKLTKAIADQERLAASGLADSRLADSEQQDSRIQRAFEAAQFQIPDEEPPRQYPVEPGTRTPSNVWKPESTLKGASSRIFVSYRRDDAVYAAGRLFDLLDQQLGADRVLMDIDTFRPGTSFTEAIADAVGSCGVLVALIGERWLMARDSSGERRIADPSDFVRLEIETALTRDIPVVPVLVDGAQLPSAGQLPASLAGLVRRQALELSSVNFDSDVRRLLDLLDSFPGAAPAAGRRTRKWFRS
jgi:hypothetical protein